MNNCHNLDSVIQIKVRQSMVGISNEQLIFHFLIIHSTSDLSVELYWIGVIFRPGLLL